MIAVAYLNDGQITWRVDWRPTTFFSAALIAWVASCLSSDPKSGESKGATSSVSQNDKNLFADFREKIDPSTLDFLKNQDLAASFLVERMEGIREVSGTFNGPDYIFDDPELQTRFEKVIALIKEFSMEVALGTQQNGQIIKMHWNHDDEEGSRARAKTLNQLGDQLYGALHEFIPFARRRLES